MEKETEERLTAIEIKLMSDRIREMLCIQELPDDYDFDKTYEAVITWCQKAFARIK